MRVYDSSGFPIVEIGYHAEPNLTGNRHDKVISMDAHKKFKSEKYSVMQFYRLHYAVFFGQSINDSAQLSVLLFYEHCAKDLFFVSGEGGIERSRSLDETDFAALGMLACTRAAEFGSDVKNMSTKCTY